MKFSDAKGIYYDKLNEIEMNKITSDILFAKARGIDLNNIRLGDVETPMEFSNFLLKISKYRKGL